nr:hypothetical protein GCM10020092_089100 [Actinoplanes digitatis]
MKAATAARASVAGSPVGRGGTLADGGTAGADAGPGAGGGAERRRRVAAATHKHRQGYGHSHAERPIHGRHWISSRQLRQTASSGAADACPGAYPTRVSNVTGAPSPA